MGSQNAQRSVRIALFNWRDRMHPAAGGAEQYTHDLLCALANAGHVCTWIASKVPGRPDCEDCGDYTVLRMGSELTCRFFAARWLWQNRHAVDVVVDEVNTLPFFSRMIAPRKTKVLIHQLAREVWWYEAPRPLAALGYVLEPLLLRLYRSTPAITISNSSASSLRAIGLRGSIDVIESPSLPPVERERYSRTPHRLGYVGRITPSKRIDHIVRAFAFVLQKFPGAQLWIVGGGSSKELAKLKRLADELQCSGRVHFTGYVSRDERDAIMASLDCLVLASVREGWGLVVSEAARFGVPAVAYDTFGLRDAIVDGVTGLLARPQHPSALATAIAEILADSEMRNRLGIAASENLIRLSYHTFSQKVRARIAEPCLRA